MILPENSRLSESTAGSIFHSSNRASHERSKDEWRRTMVELPRNEAFKTVQPAESAPAAEAMAAAAAVETPKKNGRKFFKRAVIAAALLAGAAFAGDFGHHYWTVGRFIESTDDAYVKA